MFRTAQYRYIFVFALLSALGLSAQDAQLIPRQVLFGNPERSIPQVSPDGTKLAYIAPKDGVLNIWVRGLDVNNARVVTADKKRGIRSFFWQGDSSHLLYLLDRDGDENYHLYQASLSNPRTGAQDLTPLGEVQTRIIAVNPNFPDRILIALNQRDPRYHDAYLLWPDTGKLELVAQNPGDVEYFIADNNLEVRAAFARLPDGSAEIRIRDSKSAPWRKFVAWSADEVDGRIAAFSPDNKRLWFTSSMGRDTSALIEADLVNGQQRVLAQDAHYDAGGFLAMLPDEYDDARIVVHPTKRNLQAVQFIRERAGWELVDPAIKADFTQLGKTREGDFEVISRDKADTSWIVAYTVDDGPVFYYLYRRPQRHAELLFSDRPQLEKYKLAKMQPFSFKAADGLLLHGYLTLPVVANPKKLPTVILVHGGPYARDEWGYHATVQWLANRGYAVIQLNYRGSTGYGKKYLQASFRERGGKMSTDLIDAKRWAVQQGYTDPKRTCMYGVSYGGYAVLVALAFTPDEFACGVEAFGASNLVSLLKSFPPYWALYRLQWERRVGSLAKDEEFLKSRSPLFKVQQIKAPLLIGHGVNDPRVVKAESDQVVAAIRQSGKKVEYIVFPDEGHGFLRPENRTKWFAAVETFLAQQLGGRTEPPAKEEDWSELRQ
jgi:dipeptidyl aminopeptidase/acylaminoacyl peptidase